MNNENIYDGCGIISNEVLKKNFDGIKMDEFILCLKGELVTVKSNEVIPKLLEEYK
jgi:hypothetical protein